MDFKLSILGEENNPYAYFLREAEHNKGGHITKEDVEALAGELVNDYQERGELYNATFYVYDSTEKQVWDGYFFGVDPDKKMFLDDFESLAQYELEVEYRIQLTRSRSEYVEQGKADIAFVESLNLREVIDSKYKEVFAPSNGDRLNTLKEAHHLEQRLLRLDSFKEEFADFNRREQNKLHH